jgi:Ca2+/Na+ antiporter
MKQKSPKYWRALALHWTAMFLFVIMLSYLYYYDINVFSCPPFIVGLCLVIFLILTLGDFKELHEADTEAQLEFEEKVAQFLKKLFKL